MRPRLKGTLLLLLVFGLGVAGGAAGFGLYHARFGEWRAPDRDGRFQGRILTRLTRELGLREEQRQRVESILKDAGQEFTRLREEIGPRFREIRGRSQARIREILDSAQQTKFDSLLQEWDRRIDRWRGRGAGDAPAPKGP
jgi:Spy/CpxP family protein refolding chaperone